MTEANEPANTADNSEESNPAGKGHNKLPEILERLRKGQKEWDIGAAEIAEGNSKLASGRTKLMNGICVVALALLDGKNAHSATKDFHAWLEKKGFKFAKDDRAALLGIAKNIAKAKPVLERSNRTSVRTLWEQVQAAIADPANSGGTSTGTKSGAVNGQPKDIVPKLEALLKPFVAFVTKLPADERGSVVIRVTGLIVQYQEQLEGLVPTEFWDDSSPADAP